MSENLVFSDEPIDIQQDWDGWEQAPEFAPPVPAGTYTVYVDQIRAGREFEINDELDETKKKKRMELTLDFRVVGGEYDNRTITWQRLTNAEFTRKSDGKRTSLLMDMIKAAGIGAAPRSNSDFYRVINGMKDGGPSSSFGVQVDWRGYCTTCSNKALIKATGAANIAEAKSLAKGEDYDKARDAGEKAKNSRAFPMGDNGQRKDSYICLECGNEIRAQVRVNRFLVKGA